MVGILESYRGQCEWFIESGTLLGAFRSGKFIPHDDDFDIGVFWPENALEHLFALHEVLVNRLPEPLQCRLVTSYCKKIEHRFSYYR